DVLAVTGQRGRCQPQPGGPLIEVVTDRLPGRVNPGTCIDCSEGLPQGLGRLGVRCPALAVCATAASDGPLGAVLAGHGVADRITLRASLRAVAPHAAFSG